ncbi:hypothetical protein BpHYR1_038826 [Brachionus plicatilis]|uniref:Uncharacterized protein n=1 Tax=Brachionus plicatilis TaxID=10195 RepID=A0A3M7SAG1_BRAPC|nr:hypothetical protein BpHYR1_038826 [Brachionus plicatilis]
MNDAEPIYFLIYKHYLNKLYKKFIKFFSQQKIVLTSYLKYHRNPINYEIEYPYSKRYSNKKINQKIELQFYFDARSVPDFHQTTQVLKYVPDLFYYDIPIHCIWQQKIVV